MFGWAHLARWPIQIHLEGKTALVCGASQGIGEATAHAFAQAGAQVILLARTEERLYKLAGALPHGPHRVVAVDLSEQGQLKDKIQAELNRNPIHILVNNTGGPKAGPLTEAKPEEFTKAFANHVLVAHLLTQLLLPGMKTAGYGRIINVISTSVKIPIPNLGVSNTIRGAMANWSKTLSLEVAAHGITVNNVLPGYTETPRLESLLQASAQKLGTTSQKLADEWRSAIPARRFAQSSEIASAIAFLASPLASYINGVNLPVDGGRTGSL